MKTQAEQLTLIKNARVFDGENPSLAEGRSVLIRGDRIVEIAERSSDRNADLTIDLDGRVLMPGLIDAHFHSYAAELNFALLETLPMTYLAHGARQLLENALQRGFTTVRDVAGADHGLWKAVEEGLIEGPRVFYGGAALSQTGGHGDTRAPHIEPCGCVQSGKLAHVVDGVDNLRLAAREILRQGAHHIKVFVSGGIASESDPIWMLQYSDEELRAVVDEARRRRAYVAAHAYTAETIERAVKLGIRTIEHGNLITEEVAAIVAKHGAFLVPTIVVYEMIAKHGAAAGAPQSMLDKLEDVRAQGLNAIRICRKAGVKLGFGTDLMGNLHQYQLQEFSIRAEVESPFEILNSVTAVNASILGKMGDLGCIREGALADLIVVDGNPLEDIRLMSDQDNICMVMKAGRIVRSSADMLPA